MECRKCGGDLVFFFLDFNAWTCDDMTCENYKRCGRVEECKELCKE